jgi:hypothetical protein
MSKNNLDVISQLRDDEQYYNGIGKDYLSNSDIKTLLENPFNFRVSRPDNGALTQGRLLHQMILEPHKVSDFPIVETATRNNKEYKEFVASRGIDYALLSKEVESIKEMASALTRNIYFYDEIYKEGNLFETPSIGEIKGQMWKGKADIITDQYIIDIKTTSDINKFMKSAYTYNYDSQAYIYQTLFGKPLCFFVVDKESYQIGVFTTSTGFIQSGERKVVKAIEVYNTYFSNDADKSINDYFIQDILL